MVVTDWEALFQHEQDRRLLEANRNQKKDRLSAARNPESVSTIVNQLINAEAANKGVLINGIMLLRSLETPEPINDKGPLQVLAGSGVYENAANLLVPATCLAGIAMRSGTPENSAYHNIVTTGDFIPGHEIAVPLRSASSLPEGALVIRSDQEKPFSDELTKTLTDEVNHYSEQLAAKFREFRWRYDGLCSNLFSKAHGREQMNRHLRRLDGQPLTIAFIDWDNFKEVNDQYGHLKGDYALFAFALVLGQILPIGDFAYRYGGDEFTAVFSNKTPATVEALMRTLQERARNITSDEYVRAVFPQELCIKDDIKMSIGIAQGTSSEEVIQRADEALYQAKAAGKDCIRQYPWSITPS